MLRHLYLHVPFCHHICPYCGFHKHTPGDTGLTRFVDALGTELERILENHDLKPETIYLGGGTPSLLSTGHWNRLAGHLKRLLDLSELVEWSLEANPRTFDRKKANAWRESGVTRISLGVQAFDEATLKTLGRDHSPADAERGYEILRATGFPVVSLDFMFSIPGQSLETWGNTLSRACDLEPDHLSAYNLTYEEDTEFLSRFESGEWSQDADEDCEFFRLAHEFLGRRGFSHYEVSNYARPGKESRHNRAYWLGHDYLGLGPSAVSTVAGHRWKNVADTDRYLRMVEHLGHAKTDIENLSDEQFRLERLALGLRQREGVEMDIFDLSPALVTPLLEEGLAEETRGRLHLTLEGLALADEIAAHLA